ncbi:MAG TPA: arylsulfatase, partial [Armatimonadota bacterium]|nr:arylsulfatase [Armatimonadota bacterium]
MAETQNTPNILVIFGDDIGYWNLSCYNDGMMGYRTPNIDRLAQEGARFTDYYGQQSCTAGRAAFITGQNPFRTGLTKVGFPGADIGIRSEDPTIAELLKPQGYMTGQFGKNHLGDRDEFLPTNHGFDEFFGNLYHLNAEEEPENPDYPKSPEFRKRFGPRGVIHSWANPDGTQRVEDTGPLTKKRMETVDDEFLAAAIDFLQRVKQEGKPFFMWFNSTRMHLWTHISPEAKGKTGLGDYIDGMVDHDRVIGQLLDKIDELGFKDNTIVVYTTDNGAMVSTWPDAATTPFRSEKDTNWEGGWRVPCLVRWPGVVKPGTVINDIMAGQDWLPTFMTAAGVPDITEKAKKGYRAGKKTFKVHLDGYDQTNLLSGTGPSNRKVFFYFGDDGELLAVRFERWKAHFMVQVQKGIQVWGAPFIPLRAPQLFDLRADPFERGDEGLGYSRWAVEHAFVFVPIQSLVGELVETFKEFPPRQRAASYSVDQ